MFHLQRRLGLVLLGIWLVITGLMQLVDIRVDALPQILAVLAIAAGVLLIAGR